VYRRPYRLNARTSADVAELLLPAEGEASSRVTGDAASPAIERIQAPRSRGVRRQGHTRLSFRSGTVGSPALTGGRFPLFSPQGALCRWQAHSAGGVIPATLMGRLSTVDLSLQVVEGVLCLADG
jgi:hypothetical protein